MPHVVMVPGNRRKVFRAPMTTSRPCLKKPHQEMKISILHYKHLQDLLNIGQVTGQWWQDLPFSVTYSPLKPGHHTEQVLCQDSSHERFLVAFE